MPERQTVSAGVGAFLGDPIGTFDFADVAVRGDNLEMDGKIFAGTLEFMVGMNVADFESTASVQTDDLAKFGDNGAVPFLTCWIVRNIRSREMV